MYTLFLSATAVMFTLQDLSDYTQLYLGKMVKLQFQHSVLFVFVHACV